MARNLMFGITYYYHKDEELAISDRPIDKQADLGDCQLHAICRQKAHSGNAE